MQRFSIAFAFSALVSGCIEISCTEMGCNGSYTLTFESDDWADGDYELSVALDGEEAAACTITLPLESDASCDGFTAITMADGALTVPVRTPMNDQLVEADVVLSLDGADLVSEVVEPAWGEPFWPNGESCDEGYGCLSAEDTFTL